MKRLYYSFSLLALIATNCLDTKKNTTSTKPNRSNQNKSAPVKRKKESDINKKSDLGSEEVSRSNLESKKYVKDVKDVKDIKNINDIDRNGHTPLSIAVLRDDLDQVKKLLQKGANPNICDQHSDPLRWAVHNKNKEMVSLLLSYGSEVVFDKNGYSSVIGHVSGEVGTNPEILDMIFCHFADIGKKDSVGLSPIHWACRDGHVNVVKHILNKDRSLVNNADNLYKFTPLHWAARRGFKEIVEVLVDKGASKTAKSRSGFTPLMLAISNRHEALKSILSSDGFERQSKRLNIDWECTICREGIYNPDSTDYNIAPIISIDCTCTNNTNNHKFHVDCIARNMVVQGQSRLLMACPECRYFIPQDMIQGLARNYVFSSPYSVLKAVRQQDIARLKSLLEKGGNPNESTLATSALCTAVNNHNYEMVCLLLDYGADPNYENPSSLSTPLHEAVENMFQERTSKDISNKICIALIQHGAFVNVHRLGSPKRETPKDVYCTNKDPLFVISEAGGIRSGWVTEIQPAFGLSGDRAEYKILFEDN